VVQIRFGFLFGLVVVAFALVLSPLLILVNFGLLALDGTIVVGLVLVVWGLWTPSERTDVEPP
jgi:hypothetical protein